MILHAVKRNDHCNFSCAAMSIKTSQIPMFAAFSKLQKPKYLENKTLVLKIKEFVNYTLRDKPGRKVP